MGPMHYLIPVSPTITLTTYGWSGCLNMSRTVMKALSFGDKRRPYSVAFILSFGSGVERRHRT
ncbi:hypothetical protein M406DRAFT_55913 [Cryphonectria parasitica EP155]|uniref:Uncharacterized protein n=1 Tax=Cryphonectria parasitica (strain ATCC 38755 / EP155) TaxID=660469 RepID=A0A9P4Y0U3_CRYP1|nr:uncharacterized protein M406DRAFT_55913 [Cryphonectria parasitica EP155]KAF3764471.1 hypothetical protein M406DRAFT_55913 [Cryphonectria parasitica EP155]